MGALNEKLNKKSKNKHVFAIIDRTHFALKNQFKKCFQPSHLKQAGTAYYELLCTLMELVYVAHRERLDLFRLY